MIVTETPTCADALERVTNKDESDSCAGLVDKDISVLFGVADSAPGDTREQACYLWF
jgi:hypothetical protein